ncbi:MAG: hypothetical protein GY847_19870 [Proteobacteria bacterium]|nr:hypothetical protein [Pseudomonadota bacterium]
MRNQESTRGEVSDSFLGRSMRPRQLIILGAVTIVILMALYLFQQTMGAPSRVVPIIYETQVVVTENENTKDEESFRVMTLNFAHGRASGFHQALCSKETLLSNLDRIARLIDRESPDIVAVQEVDAPSFWSGDFNHLEYVARTTGLKYFVQSEHVSGMGLHYGTGLMSIHPLSQALAYTFSPSPPTFSKGFTLSSIVFSKGRVLDVVSLHTDFSRESVRIKQIEEMVDVLTNRNSPLIIMGDFNSQWIAEEDTVRRCARKLNLHTFKPEDKEMVTFETLDARLDYILISDDLEFTNHVILPDAVSDHKAVIADIKFKDKD